MSTYFASDIHLDPARPEGLAAFTQFLSAIADEAEALYLLGDLFEMWIGDDDDDVFSTACCRALATSTARHPVYALHGNRDFLLASGFTARTQVGLLSDPSAIDLYGCTTLISHGDVLCIDDAPYMQMRTLLRSNAWQTDILSRSLDERRALGANLRARSRAESANKPSAIMDVNEAAALALCTPSSARVLIHGHTHRPGTHTRADGGLRVVLGAWDPHGLVLRVQSDGRYALLPSNAIGVINRRR